MGQYFKPVILESDEYVNSHNYNNGLKLMEHSWINNNFVRAVERLLTKGNVWYKKSLVWAGDYADEEVGTHETLYSLAITELEPKPINKNSFHYVVNHTKKEYIDKRKTLVSDVWENDKGEKTEFRIHPLPLMTCEGNGRGGGDFRGTSGLIGSWARNSISIESRKPNGYKEVIFDLIEK